MSLQKQLVHLNMTGGLQKKDDGFIVIPSKLARADDVEFEDASTVKRRGGQSRLTLPSGYSTVVRSFKRNENLNIEMQDGSTVRVTGAATPAADYGAYAGDYLTYEPSKFMRVGSSTRRITGSVDAASSYSGYDVAKGGSTYCVAWVGTTSAGNYGIRASVRRVSDDTELFSRFLTSAVASENVYQPRVVYDSTNARYILLGYFEDTAFVTASVQGIYFTESGSSVSGTISVIGATLTVGSYTPMIDAAIVQGQGVCVVMRENDVGSRIRMRLVNLALTPIVAATVATPATAPQSLTAHAVYVAGVLYGYALYGAGANLRGYRLPSNTGVMSAETTVTTLPAGSVGRVVVTDVSGLLHITVDNYTNTANTYATTYLVSATQALVFGSRTAISTNCFIAGRSFSMRGSNFVPLVFESNSFQGTLLVLNISVAAANLGVATTANPSFVARVDYGEVAMTGFAANTHLRVPGVDVEFISYKKYETDLRTSGTSNLTPTCLSVLELDEDAQLGEREVNGLAYLAAALPLVCDGVQIVEEGFHWGPEVQGGSLTPAAAGILTFPNATATYTVCFTEGWSDAQGNWHESAPSPEYVVSITAGSGNYSVNPTLVRPPSLKSGRQLVMYRTLGSSTDTSLYLTEAATTEANLPRGEQLYTAGGVLPNTPMPACRHLSIFQKRLVASGCGDGSRVYWSKQSTPGYGVEFSSGDPTHQTVVPADKGRVVATEEMDDRLVVLCENGIGVIGGTGPDPTGTQGQYSDYSSAVTELGALWNNPKSVIRGPEGVWFLSPQGIRLFSRGGSIARAQDGKQAGAEVDPLVTSSSTSPMVAVAEPTRQQVRFYQREGTVLVWDYQWQQWTRFTGMSSVDAVYADSKALHLYNVSGTPLVRYTDDAAMRDYSDFNATAPVSGVIETPWLSFAGIQGFQRIYRLMVLGQNVVSGDASDQTVNGALYYDFDATTLPAEAQFSLSQSPVGGMFQIQHHLVRQKCEALKIVVSFGPASPTIATSNFRLTDLTLQVGAKSGYFKVPSSRRI